MRGSLTDRVSRWLLRWWYTPDEVEEALADLGELRELRRRERGRFPAALYYWTELVRYPVAAMRDLVVSGRAAAGRRGRSRRMGGFREDLGYAVRSLVRKPWFGILTGGILAVTVAANAAIFSVVRSVLVDGLPVSDPDRLFTVWTRDRDSGQAGRMTPGGFTDISTLDDVFESVAAFGGVSATLLGLGEPEVLSGGRVTAGYFEVLGVRPALGRAFYAEEDEAGAAPVVILGHGVWTRRFGADPSIVGRDVDFDGTLFEVIGVLPAGLYPTSAALSAEVPFTGDNQDFFVPLRYGPDLWRNRRSHILGMVGRLRPDVTAAAADVALETLAATVTNQDPVSAGETFFVRPFREEVVGDVRFGLLMLMGTVGLVLVIAAANVAALFVLRTDDRLGELAVRTAVGASRGRLVRQLFLESGLVTGAGLLAGILGAGLLVSAMQRMVPFQIPRLGEARVDGAVVAVTTAIGVLLAVAFGLASALGATRSPAAPARTRGAAGRPGRARLQAGAVAIQAALAVVVLVGATLLTRSFVALRAVDAGFEATDAWVFQLGGSSARIDEVLERVRALPGIAGAAVAYDHPLERNWMDSFIIEKAPVDAADEPTYAALRIVGDGWFQTAGIPLLDGRAPDRFDEASARGVAVVNRALADRHFPDGRVLGRRIQVPSGRRMFGDGAPEWYEIVGVAGNVRFLGPDAAEEPALYLPASQFPATTSRLLVRPAGNSTAFATVRATIREVDATLPLDDARRMDAVLDDMLARPRFNTAVLAAFAAVGLALCAMGIYGLVSRVVVSRVREIGIRTALGASPLRLTRNLLATAMWPTALGTLIGLASAVLTAGLLRSVLFGISSHDPLTLVSVPAFVLTVAVLAALRPTLRALRIDPATTLREE